MDLNSLTRNADELIRKVVARYNQLYIPAGQISQVELDLMLDDLRKLYDTFKQIGQANIAVREKVQVRTEAAANEHIENQIVSETKTETKTETNEQLPPKQPEPEPELPEEKMVEEEKPLKEFFFPMVDSEPEPLVQESAPANQPASPPYTEPEKSIPHTVIATDKAADQLVSPHAETKESNETPATLADRFGQHAKSLSETIGRSAPGYVGARLLQPIADLTSGIGLNDKFSFISDLFDNNQAAYEEAITRINKAVNADEAEWILNRYQQPHWSEKAGSVERMKEFVRRRFL